MRSVSPKPWLNMLLVERLKPGVEGDPRGRPPGDGEKPARRVPRAPRRPVSASAPSEDSERVTTCGLPPASVALARPSPSTPDASI